MLLDEGFRFDIVFTSADSTVADRRSRLLSLCPFASALRSVLRGVPGPKRAEGRRADR